MALDTTPRTWLAGQIYDAPDYNAEIRDAFKGIQAPWTVFAPDIAAGGTSINIGNGTVDGHWIRHGATAHFWVRVIAGSTTTWGSGILTVSLPAHGRPGAVDQATGVATTVSPIHGATIRNHATALIRLHEMGTTVAATVASLGLTTTTTLTVSGTYETPEHEPA